MINSVLLIADLEDWILGKMAREYRDRLEGNIRIGILYSKNKYFYEELHALQKQYDVIHLLSSSEIYENGHRVVRPCVATIWHMVNWKRFDQACWRIDAIYAGSNQWKYQVEKHLSTNVPIHRLHYGVDYHRFSPQSSAKNKFLESRKITLETMVLGFAGSAWSNEGNRKGLDRLWECLRTLNEAPKIPYVMRIAGRNWKKEMIPEDLQKNVILELDIPEHQLPEFYAGLDYYVCTSRAEGIPYPVLEAMSSEVVVMSTPVGVVPEIISPGENGFVLRDDNVASDFHLAVRSTWNRLSARRQCGTEARKTIIKKFSWDNAMNPEDMYRCYENARKHYAQRSLLERINIRSREYWEYYQRKAISICRP